MARSISRPAKTPSFAINGVGVKMSDVSTRHSSSRAARVGEIDFLRFSAALMVVLFHYGFRGYAADNLSNMPYPLMAPIFKYGYLGVELFFIISGFVILMTASSGSLRKFAISRIVRLYPAFWACCTITFLFIFFAGGGLFSATFRQYVINMTMLNEFVGVNSIDGVYWSLAVEMKFYGLVALVLLLRQLHRTELILMCWLAATIAAWLVPVGWTIRWILIADYSPYFIAGACCYLIYANGLSTSRALIVLTSWAVAMSISFQSAAGLARQFKEDFNPLVIATIITSFFALMLLVSLKRTGSFGRGNWVAIGALTYPLYLIHQKLGYMIFNAAYPNMNAHIVLWGTLLFMVLAAHTIHRQIELRYAKPFKTKLEQLADRISASMRTKVAGRRE